MAIKKIWYDIVSPPMFGSAVVGQTLAAEPKQLPGRSLKIALPDMGIDSKKFYIKTDLRIESVDGTRALTKFVGHECVHERISRMVQRYSKRIDCIQDVDAKDGKIRVKTVMIIPKRVSTSIKDAVRAKVRETVSQLVPSMSVEEFIKAVIDDRFQSEIKKSCRKIYPLGIVEIRKSEVL
jgi:small subunit ribosomal protein S3Ae